MIVLSADAGLGGTGDLLRLQGVDPFRKPIDHARLLETLDTLLPRACRYLVRR